MNISDLSSYFSDITGYVLVKRLLIASGLYLSSCCGLTPALCVYLGFTYKWTWIVTHSVGWWYMCHIPIHSLGLIKFMAGHNDFNYRFLYMVNGTIQKVTPIEFYKLTSAVDHSNLEAFLTKMLDNSYYYAVDPNTIIGWVSVLNL